MYDSFCPHSLIQVQKYCVLETKRNDVMTRILFLIFFSAKYLQNFWIIAQLKRSLFYDRKLQSNNKMTKREIFENAIINSTEANKKKKETEKESWEHFFLIGFSRIPNKEKHIFFLYFFFESENLWIRSL